MAKNHSSILLFVTIPNRFVDIRTCEEYGKDPVRREENYRPFYRDQAYE